MKQYLIVGGILCLSLLGVFTSPVSADMADACNKNGITGDAKSACEAGYGGSECAPFQSNKVHCEAGAAQAEKDGTLPQNPGGNNQNTGGTEGKSKCGGAKTEIVSCDESAGLGAIASLIKTAIMILTIMIGIVAVGGITYAAIIYASARDNQGQVQEALTIIRNVVIGLVLYGLSIAIINWLIPGGVIG